MKKVLMILICCSLTYADMNSRCYEFSPENPVNKYKTNKAYSLPENQFTYDKGVAWFKEKGFLYAIGYDIFNPNTIGYTICSGINNVDEAYMELVIFIENYKLDDSRLFTQALNLYTSPQYQEEVERIVKKYCKNCK